MKSAKLLLVFMILFLFLPGCATTIGIMVTKPAEVNMAGAKKVAIMDFIVVRDGTSLSYDDIFNQAIKKAYGMNILNTLEQRLATFTTNELLNRLAATNYFEIISPTAVSQAIIKAGKIIRDPLEIGSLAGAEAIILGDIVISSKTEKIQKEKEVKDSVSGKKQKVFVYDSQRTVRMNFRYRAISTSTGQVLATRTFIDSKSSTKEQKDADQLPSYEDMLKSLISQVIPRIAHQIAPYTVKEYRSLADDKTKNPRMKEADEMVKKDLLQEALDVYREVWDSSQNPAAAVNGAIMLEALGDVAGAVAWLQEAASVKADKMVTKELSRLKKVQADLKKLEEQMK